MDSEPNDARSGIGGRLQGVSPPDLLWRLRCERRTGVLVVRDERHTKTFYVDRGRIVFARSTHVDDRLGAVLLRDGRVTLEQLEAAVVRLAPGKRLGTLLVEDGALTPEDLVDGVLRQVREIVLDWFTWKRGEYEFREGDLPTDEVIQLDVDMGGLILQGIRRISSFQEIRRSVGPLRTVYGLTADWRRVLDGVDLAEGDEVLLVHLEQGDTTVESLCDDLFLSNFEIYQTLWALRVMGAVEERVKHLEVDGMSRRGSLADRPFPDLLVELAGADVTGVLHVQRDEVERTFHIDRGRCLFATSNRADDGLMAYLLRRGVISLRDRDEATRRLLTNKRVGTILLEMGVIDTSDLTEMVRQQLTEILFDTLGWTRGEFAFQPGDLPTVEKITMQASVEQLVAEGLRQVTAWERIVEGIGGLHARLELTPSYLDRLDALHGGPEEWQVVAALRESATPRELCQRLELPDFRVCQILWALRVLGAVVVCDADRVVEQGDEGEARDATEERDERDGAPAPAVPVTVTVEPDATVDAEPEPVAVGPDPDLDRTQRLDREEVEAAIRRAPEPEYDDPTPESEASPESAGWETFEDRPVTIDIVEADAPPVEVPIASDEPAADDEPIAVVGHDHGAPEPDADGPEGGDGDDADDADDEPPSLEIDDTPAEVEDAIRQLNTMQRLVFRAVKAEVGAGTANLIRACRQSAGDGLPALDDAELLEDGTWDADALRRAARGSGVEDPMADYRRLIDLELEQLGMHLGETRAADLREQLDRVAAGDDARR